MQNYHSNLLDQIKPKIYFIRGYRVMLDTDLAILYGVETKTLNQAVSRNLGRFPNDFAFQLTENEEKNLKSPLENQIVHGGKRKLSTAFTEQGIAMISSVLRSETAIKVNIEIMRTFVKMKSFESENQAVWQKFDQLEKKYDANFSGVFEAIRQIMSSELPNQHRKIKSPSE